MCLWFLVETQDKVKTFETPERMKSNFDKSL